MQRNATYYQYYSRRTKVISCGYARTSWDAEGPRHVRLGDAQPDEGREERVGHDDHEQHRDLDQELVGAPDEHAADGHVEDDLRKRHLFFEFSLCLSRACLGKMMHFIYKWRKNGVFRTGSKPSVRIVFVLSFSHDCLS